MNNSKETLININKYLYKKGVDIIIIDGPYKGLTGFVLEVRAGEEKDTDNPYDDIYVSLDCPDDGTSISQNLISLFGVDTIEEVALDIVIVDPSMLKKQEWSD